jgi:hypothetical protein
MVLSLRGVTYEVLSGGRIRTLNNLALWKTQTVLRRWYPARIGSLVQEVSSGAGGRAEVRSDYLACLVYLVYLVLWTRRTK